LRDNTRYSGSPVHPPKETSFPTETSTSRTTTARSRYLLPNGDVYQDNGDGTCSWVPDVDTANAMGLDWNDLAGVSSLPCTVGEPFPSTDG
jgi:hypothetical protein